MHDIYTEEVNKVALSADDDKRTLAYGHYQTVNEEFLKRLNL